MEELFEISDHKDVEIAEKQAIINMLMEYKVNFMGRVCAMRDVKVPCPNCGGLGIQLYNNASTWRHLDGFPPRVTKDVCEHCWGSGDKENTWPVREVEKITIKHYPDFVHSGQFQELNHKAQFPCEAGGNQFPCDASTITDAEVIKEATNGQEDGSI